jgi:folate-dependent phosphoribosylglycinamide formyltransferase PurN
MDKRKLKVIVLTHGGVIRLLELLSAIETVEIAGIFLETAITPERSLKQKIERSIRYDGYWETFKKFSGKFFGRENGGSEDTKTIYSRQEELEKFATQRSLPFFKVENFHHAATLDLIRQTNAELGVLYGTNIIRESVFSIPKRGSINLHQGLAPFYRGGPTVFWELFNGERQVGVTVHYVAAEVDTGDIILQKTVPLEYDFSRYGLDYQSFLRDYRASLVEPSMQMVAEAVRLISEGRETRTKQDTSLGRRYRLPVKSEKDALLRILRKRQKQNRS